MAKVRLLDPTDSKRRLDRYELIGELASGGMATVFLGRLGGVGGFQRFVAIKRLHPHLAQEEEFIEMFLDEARLAAGIHHPHVVPILEVGQSDSGYYLVMEYIEGDTLARIVARSVQMANPVPRPILLRVILDALAGLHAAHELTDDHGQLVQLVHRDVSPQNILVGVDGCSRLTDFGVARAASRLSNTRTDRLKGKLAYMSPEQARAGAVDRRSDLFAMGIILWEVLATRRLFKGETEVVTLNKVTAEPIPRLSSVLPGAHPALDQVCHKALERDPNKRYKSAADMAEALERAARAAASASPTDLGVASPREVAAYVQGALGQDIAAQRESVRAWLSHSEPSMPRLSGVKPVSNARPDVTFKIALDRDGAEATTSGTRSAARPAPEADAAPASTPAPREDTGNKGKLVLPLADDLDEEDEGETQLMDREKGPAAILAALGKSKATPPPPSALEVTPAPAPAPIPVPPAPISEDGTPSASIEALAIPPPPPPSRLPQVVAIVVGLLLALGGIVVWLELRSGEAPPPRSGGSPAPPTASIAPKPATTPAAAIATTPPAPTPSDLPAIAPPSGAPSPPVLKGRLPRGKASASHSAAAPEPARPLEPARPPEPAKPPEPTKPPEDMANPYR